jgi:ABC-type phosphate/phosphonate transport system substrate-binding protein
VRDAFLSFDLTSIDTANILKGFGHKFVPADDALYAEIRDLAQTMNMDPKNL